MENCLPTLVTHSSPETGSEGWHMKHFETFAFSLAPEGFLNTPEMCSAHAEERHTRPCTEQRVQVHTCLPAHLPVLAQRMLEVDCGCLSPFLHFTLQQGLLWSPEPADCQ